MKMLSTIFKDLIMKTKSTGKQSSILVNTIPRNKRLLSFNIGEGGFIQSKS